MLGGFFVLLDLIDHHEFISAKTGQKCVLRKLVSESTGYLIQELISYIMTERIVDVLKMIQIHKEYCIPGGL